MLFTAKEARERIDSLKNNKLEEEKIMAESKIVTAVENGDDSCHIGYVEFETAQWLESLGYGIERITSPKDGSDTIVKW